MDVVSDLLDRCTSPEDVVLDGPANVAWAVHQTEARAARERRETCPSRLHRRRELSLRRVEDPTYY